MKTFDQCKDEVAKKLEYLDWNILSRRLVSMGHTKILDSYYNEAAELYAQEVAKDAWDRACEASPIYVRYMRTVIESFEQELSICRVKPPYQPNQEKP